MVQKERDEEKKHMVVNSKDKKKFLITLGEALSNKIIFLKTSIGSSLSWEDLLSPWTFQGLLVFLTAVEDEKVITQRLGPLYVYKKIMKSTQPQHMWQWKYC